MPASPLKITREVTLEGQLYRIAVDMNFYQSFQEMTGRDLLYSRPNEWQPNAKEATAMVACALEAGGHSLTLKEVGAMIHPGNAEYIMGELQALMKANAPKANGADPLAQEEAQPSPPTG